MSGPPLFPSIQSYPPSPPWCLAAFRIVGDGFIVWGDLWFRFSLGSIVVEGQAEAKADSLISLLSLYCLQIQIKGF